MSARERSLTNRLRVLRAEKDMTQEALADAVGVSRQTIIAIEKGDYAPSVLLALLIAEYFGVAMEQTFQISSPATHRQKK